MARQERSRRRRGVVRCVSMSVEGVVRAWLGELLVDEVVM